MKKKGYPQSGKETLETAVIIVGILFSAFVLVQPAAAGNQVAEELAEVGEEGLMMFFDPEEIMTGVGTLTSTPRRHIPAAVTRITQDMIRSSGARSLYELFDIYVPNFQWIKHNYLGPHFGLRGIISDKDEKYLLLVNGRTMNERTTQGTNPEQDMPMLDDIHHIDIIRGPGSAIYGLGAVSMVVDIHTETANTFQGSKITTKVGAFEEFYTLEFKHGRMLDEDTGLYIYGGISEYPGADRHYAPQIFGLNDDTRWGKIVERGEPVRYDYTRDRASYRGLPKLKFHAELTTENMDLWVRYTRGGQHFTTTTDVITEPNNPPSYQFSHKGVGYQQLTAYGKYHQELTDTLSVDYVLSYDFLDTETVNHNSTWGSYREDEYLGRILARWIPNDRHSVAVGFENSTENFGLRSPGFPHESPSVTPRWSTNTTSVFGEHQFKVNDQWTTFLGIRADKNTYSDLLYSPRAAAVYTPTDKDTWKFMYSRSMRHGFAQRIRNEYKNGVSILNDAPGYPDPETLEGYEIRYERQHTKNLRLGCSAFLNNAELVGWSGTEAEEGIPGDTSIWGLEFEAAYTTDRLEILLSHGYSKLYDYDLDSGVENLIYDDPVGTSWGIMGSPINVGYPALNDLSNWSNHISKLYARYKLTPKLSMDGSLIVYYAFDGLEEYVKRVHSDRFDAGWDRAYGPNVYLNLGLEYNATKNLDIRLSGYNLLGLIDRDLNKRNYLGQPAYRCHAPAVAVTCEYRF